MAELQDYTNVLIALLQNLNQRLLEQQIQLNSLRDRVVALEPTGTLDSLQLDLDELS